MTRHPTAVFCANNNMTMGALATLRRLHIRIPDDLALVAFDDLEWSDIIEPGIASQAQPLHAMGNQALQLLLDHMESPDSPAQTSQASTVIRASTVLRFPFAHIVLASRPGGDHGNPKFMRSGQGAAQGNRRTKTSRPMRSGE